jgi:AAA domain, putative AbiEii toxin, Type IV TA system
MLESLHLRNVGPASELKLDAASRLNLITGDNGLGKSFLLDVAWWALTRTWVGVPALPGPAQRGTISYVVHGKAGQTAPVTSTFQRSDESWPLKAKRPPMPGIVVYIRIDGGFSVWDPARNYWRNDPDRPAAYHFTAADVWDGLTIGDRRASEGLERDWVSWQEGRKPQFKALEKVLEIISPPAEPLRAGAPRRLLVGEGRDRPTLLIGGQEVPVALASAGVRRVLALAYFLVWAWHEHRLAAQLLNKSPEDRFVILFDEPETHLHPRWQRTIVPSVLAAIDVLRGAGGPPPQLFIATHSPLVLASIEPKFSAELDELFHLKLEAGQVVLETGGWATQGDVSEWLLSDVFGLEQARSIEAEQAIEAAEALMRGEKGLPKGLATQREIHEQLRRLLPANDQFWPRWLIDGEAMKLVKKRTNPAAATKTKRSRAK